MTIEKSDLQPKPYPTSWWKRFKMRRLPIEARIMDVGVIQGLSLVVKGKEHRGIFYVMDYLGIVYEPPTGFPAVVPGSDEVQ